jgi:subtilisin family serine protease
MISAEPADKKINIIVDLNRCVNREAGSGVVGILAGYGEVVYVGKVVTFAVISNVSLGDIPAISSRPEIAMVELYTPMMPNVNFSVKAIKVTGGTMGTNPFTYSPQTLENYRPDLVGTGINIAVVDSGVDNGHESLTGSFIAGGDFTVPASPGVFVATDPDDESGHGTHVASIALGRGAPDGSKRGVASGANLIDLKIFRGSDNFNPVGATEAALEWIILNKDTEWGGGHPRGIDVVNLSFSGCDNSDGKSTRDQLVNAIVANGIVVTTSAGNRNSECGDSSSGIVNRIPSVAAADLPITVANSVTGSISTEGGGFSFAATIDRSDDEIFFESLRGPRSDGGQKPDVAAPGTAINAANYNTTNGYIMKVGTSMSAPHVAGLTGIILQQTPTINPGSLKDLLIRTAYRTTATGPDVLNPTWDANWGFGLVDAYQAIWQVTAQGEAQSDLTFEGFDGATHPEDPVWMSSAIRFNYGTDHRDVLRIGEANEMLVNILNRDRAAENVMVNFGIYYFSASDPDRPQFYQIHSQAYDFPVGLTPISYTWTPSSTFDIFSDPDAHICIRITINYGLDSNFTNHSNVAQRNLQRVEIASPAKFNFRVENPLNKKAIIHLRIREADKNPPKWTIKLSDNDFELEPFSCARNIQAVVTPPPGVGPGLEATYHIFATARIDNKEEVAIGGLTVQAYSPDKPKPTIYIWILIISLVIVIILISRIQRRKHHRTTKI